MRYSLIFTKSLFIYLVLLFCIISGVKSDLDMFLTGFVRFTLVLFANNALIKVITKWFLKTFDKSLRRYDLIIQAWVMKTFFRFFEVL